MGKDVEWKSFFQDNHRYADIINGIGCGGVQLVKDTDVFQTDVKQVFDFIRCSDDMDKLLDLVENDTYFKEMNEDAFDVVTKYTNSKELVKVKDYTDKGGKNDVCKAIQDLMADSREKGREEGREEGIRTLVKTLREFQVSEDEIVKRIRKDFGVKENEVQKYI